MARLKDSVQNLRIKLREAKTEHNKLVLSLAEAAQHAASLDSMLTRVRGENTELQKNLDFQRLRLNGFQLELSARHYELPFIAAQIEALLQGGKHTPAVVHSLQSIKESLVSLIEFMNGQKPSLDPTSWVILARKLGLGLDFQTRRTPVKSVESTEKPKVTGTPESSS